MQSSVSTRLFFCKALLLILVSAVPAWSQLTITKMGNIPSPLAIDNSAANSGSSAIANNNAKGQNISFAGDAHLTGILLRTHSYSTGGAVTFEIHAASGIGQPFGSAIYSDSAI